jgi:hypothetical protein
MGHRDDDIGTPALPPHALFLFRRPVAGFRALDTLFPVKCFLSRA